MKNFFTFSLVVMSVLMTCGGLTGSRFSNSKTIKSESPKVATYNGGYAQQYSKANLSKEADKTTGKPTVDSKRGIGISAWGIVAITLSIIILSAGTYYFIIFYPLVCKKERNYDVIELSPV